MRGLNDRLPHSAIAVPESRGALDTADFGTRSGRPRTDTLAWATAAILSLLLLLAPALWNGYPILQWDTGGYLARWFEGYLVPSRPGAYGLFIAAAIPLAFWPNILIQAAATVWILALVLRTHGLAQGPWNLLLVTGILSVATALPFIASLLLTDIFCGLAVLALYLLVFRGDRLGRFTRGALIGFSGFAAATHSATFGLLALLVLAALLAHFLFRNSVRIPPHGIRRAGCAVALGLLLTFAGNYAVSRQWAWTPGGYGILFGRMLEDGIVKRYLDARCPDPQLKLCAHRFTMPQTADAFLWGNSVFNDLGRFAGLGAEMQVIVVGSLKDYPLLQLKAAIAATGKQLFSVGTGEGVVNTLWHTYGIMERFTPQALPAMRAARQQRGEMGFATANILHRPVAILSILALPLLILLARRTRRLADLKSLATAATLAILGNAAICGVLSNPHDRYGSRLAWVATLVLLVAAIAALQSPQPLQGEPPPAA